MKEVSRSPLFVLLLLPICASAQLGIRDLERAQARVAELTKLLEEGAASRAELDRAMAALADARDAVLLDHTLYGSLDLTEEEAAQMIEAAGRRVERRRQELEQSRRAVEEGGAPRLSLGLPLENLDRARRELDLAESRARTVRNLVEMARAEQELAARERDEEDFRGPLLDSFDGGGVLTPGEILVLENAFAAKFQKPLPVSARGDTAVHRALGFDHRHRLDVAVHPDDPEGTWLRQFLVDRNISFFTFRHEVRGRSTGAHIHVGPQSSRLARGT